MPHESGDQLAIHWLSEIRRTTEVFPAGTNAFGGKISDSETRHNEHRRGFWARLSMRSSGDARVDHNALSQAQRAPLVVQFGHGAAAAQPHDHRQPVGDACAAVAHVQVHSVDGGRTQADEHLPSGP